MNENSREQEQKEVKERLAEIETHLKYTSTREDIITLKADLKFWVIGLFAAIFLIAIGSGTDELRRIFGDDPPSKQNSQQPTTNEE